jgi:phospholipid/cholesterol/gamma-HCH transport system permease protein
MAEATVSASSQGSGTALTFAGTLDVAGAAAVWEPTMRAAAAAKDRALVFDLSGVKVIDTAGASMLAAAEAAHGAPATLKGEREDIQALLNRVRATRTKQVAPVPVPDWTFTGLFLAVLHGTADAIGYLGEVAVSLARAPARRRMLRMGDILRYADQAGFSALPLILLMGFLIGLILAFQSAVPMKKFGADLFVVDLVTISLVRELGPLLTAVVLSGRTGSAFAAEIGTMKVNEEVDALNTMGLDPMTMLVLPRLIAVMIVMPAMTMVMNLAGLFGMTVVMRAFGFPMITILNQMSNAATPIDLFGGLFKATVFGAAVAAIACRAGLTTGVGPRAVGLSATSAVVGGIVATIAIDGVFSIVFYRLGL